ncbi:tubulin epsilon chain-like [Cylas formicarius]|uniref:tubulin epsilon chain-like n=1 Tax=Cylas formicarius TaxID=197179 RepID=UPI0029588CB8|nr:tubulin epsilon chain-like [Cylas formicarius]
MSEFIILQVGQCGNQIGAALWPLILSEYRIRSNDSISAFFNVPSRTPNDLKARAICIDMEDSVVARFKRGPLKGMFDDKCFITNHPGSGNNWAQGYCEHGPRYKRKIFRALKHAVERCDSLHGFILLLSAGGGTGSGLGTYILDLLADTYPEIERFVACVYPTGTEDVITCPYNMALATYRMLENAVCVFPVENRALLEIVNRKSRCGERSYRAMNDIIVEMLLHLTSGSRFPGDLNLDMNEINTNMVPFPQLNFLSAGFNHDSVAARFNTKTSQQIKDKYFLDSLHKSNQLIKVDPLGPKSVLLGATLIGRGDYAMSDVQSYAQRLQARANFAPWSKKSIKVGLCGTSPHYAPAAMFSLFNSSRMSDHFAKIYGDFDKLFRKKAHMHHYTRIDGFDCGYFEACAESLRDVVQKYRNIEMTRAFAVPRLEPLQTF